MKIKAGFVTNSSSTAYVIMGYEFDMSDFLNSLGLESYDDFLYSNIETNLDIHGRYGDAIIGYSYSKLQEDQTLREFKVKVQKDVGCFIKKYDLKDPKWIEWAEYDG